MPETRVVLVGNVLVRYAVAGRGSPIVLIHGLAASGRWWRRNVPVLQRSHTVYILDLPGFGWMRAYRRDFPLERMPEWLAAVLDALGLRRVSLIGHSMGGTVALLFAATWPHRVEKLVIAAPAVNMPCRTILGNALPFLRSLCRTPLRLAPQLVWDGLRAGPICFVDSAAKVLKLEVTDELRLVRSPTLLLWGSRDALVPPTVAQALNRAIAGSESRVIPGAGHAVMFERADEFNRSVLEFLIDEENAAGPPALS